MMKDFLTRDRLPLIGGILGFILAVLFFTVGFFKTILLIRRSDRHLCEEQSSLR